MMTGGVATLSSSLHVNGSSSLSNNIKRRRSSLSDRNKPRHSGPASSNIHHGTNGSSLHKVKRCNTSTSSTWELSKMARIVNTWTQFCLDARNSDRRLRRSQSQQLRPPKVAFHPPRSKIPRMHVDDDDDDVTMECHEVHVEEVEFDPDEAVLTLRDASFVTIDHDEVPWYEQEYEELPWWEYPDLDEDDEVTALVKDVIRDSMGNSSFNSHNSNSFGHSSHWEQKQALRVEALVMCFALKLRNRAEFTKLQKAQMQAAVQAEIKINEDDIMEEITLASETPVQQQSGGGHNASSVPSGRRGSHSSVTSYEGPLLVPTVSSDSQDKEEQFQHLKQQQILNLQQDQHQAMHQFLHPSSPTKTALAETTLVRKITKEDVAKMVLPSRRRTPKRHGSNQSGGSRHSVLDDDNISLHSAVLSTGWNRLNIHNSEMRRYQKNHRRSKRRGTINKSDSRGLWADDHTVMIGGSGGGHGDDDDVKSITSFQSSPAMMEYTKTKQSWFGHGTSLSKRNKEPKKIYRLTTSATTNLSVSEHIPITSDSGESTPEPSTRKKKKKKKKKKGHLALFMAKESLRGDSNSNIFDIFEEEEKDISSRSSRSEDDSFANDSSEKSASSKKSPKAKPKETSLLTNLGVGNLHDSANMQDSEGSLNFFNEHNKSSNGAQLTGSASSLNVMDKSDSALPNPREKSDDNVNYGDCTPAQKKLDLRSGSYIGSNGPDPPANTSSTVNSFGSRLRPIHQPTVESTNTTTSEPAAEKPSHSLLDTKPTSKIEKPRLTEPNIQRPSSSQEKPLPSARMTAAGQKAQAAVAPALSQAGVIQWQTKPKIVKKTSSSTSAIQANGTARSSTSTEEKPKPTTNKEVPTSPQVGQDAAAPVTINGLEIRNQSKPKLVAETSSSASAGPLTPQQPKPKAPIVHRGTPSPEKDPVREAAKPEQPKPKTPIVDRSNASPEKDTAREAAISSTKKPVQKQRVARRASGTGVTLNLSSPGPLFLPDSGPRGRGPAKKKDDDSSTASSSQKSPQKPKRKQPFITRRASFSDIQISLPLAGDQNDSFLSPKQTPSKSILSDPKLRLVMLRHAAMCNYAQTGGVCPSDPKCSQMKELLRHMTVCKHTSNLVPCNFPGCHESKSFLVLMHKASRILQQQKDVAKDLPPVVTIPTHSSHSVNGKIAHDKNVTALADKDDDDVSDIGSFGSAGDAEDDDSSTFGGRQRTGKSNSQLDVSTQSEQVRANPADKMGDRQRTERRPSWKGSLELNKQKESTALRDKQLAQKIQREEEERKRAQSELRKRHEAVKARVLAKVNTIIKEQEELEAKAQGMVNLKRVTSEGNLLVKLDSKKDLMAVSQILKSSSKRNLDEKKSNATNKQMPLLATNSNSSRALDDKKHNVINSSQPASRLGAVKPAIAVDDPKKKTEERVKSETELRRQHAEEERAKAEAELRRKHAELKARVDKSKVEHAQAEAMKSVKSVHQRAARRKSLPASVGGFFQNSLPSIYDHIVSRKQASGEPAQKSALPANSVRSSVVATNTGGRKSPGPALPSNPGRKSAAPVLPSNTMRRATTPPTAFQKSVTESRKVVQAMQEKSKAAEQERVAAERQRAEQERAIYQARDARRDEKQEAAAAREAQEAQAFAKKEQELAAAAAAETKPVALLVSDKVYAAKVEATSEVERLKAAKLAKKAKREQRRASLVVTK